MLGPGDHTSFRNKTSTAINAAIKYGKNFKDFTPDSWTTYLSSALKDPRPVLQRISRSKAAVAACPLPIAEDVVAAPIREPAVDSRFLVPMELVAAQEPLLVDRTVSATDQALPGEEFQEDGIRWKVLELDWSRKDRTAIVW